LADLNIYDGIIVPGGFGERGIEGKIKAIQFAREHKIPYLGLCYGMQLSVIEFARNVVGLTKSHTTEINPKTIDPVIDIIEEQKENLNNKKMGGTMRLGEYDCEIQSKTLVRKLYGASNIKERHRHRYEFNNKYKEQLVDNGLVISGINKEKDLVEIIELGDHPFFVGTQFHPELISRPLNPHPIFKGFIRASIKR